MKRKQGSQAQGPAETLLAFPRPTEIVDGRDEMNLCELAFSVLSQKAVPHITEIPRTVKMFDRQEGRYVERSWLIQGPAGIGVPIAVDEWVVNGLMKLSKANDFATDQVQFYPRDLFRILGWQGNGRDYRRLLASFTRLRRVSIRIEEGWFDNEVKALESVEEFSILSHFKLVHAKDLKREQRRSQQLEFSFDWPVSVATWNPVLFKSFQDNFIKKLDLDDMRSLGNETARKLYRLVDKHFGNTRSKHQKRDEFRWDLHELGQQRIGMTGQKYRNNARAIKDQLDKGYDECIRIGKIAPLSGCERYQRNPATGNWEVVVRRPVQAQVSVPEVGQVKTERSKEQRWVEQLVERNVTRRTAEELVKQYPGRIEEKIELGDWKTAQDGEQVGPGFYRAAIVDDYKLPKGFETKAQREQRQTKDTERSQLLKRLSGKEGEQFVTKSGTQRICADGYRAVEGERRTTLFSQLKTEHLERLLELLEGGGGEKKQAAAN